MARRVIPRSRHGCIVASARKSATSVLGRKASLGCGPMADTRRQSQAEPPRIVSSAADRPERPSASRPAWFLWERTNAVISWPARACKIDNLQFSSAVSTIKNSLNTYKNTGNAAICDMRAGLYEGVRVEGCHASVLRVGGFVHGRKIKTQFGRENRRVGHLHPHPSYSPPSCHKSPAYPVL